MVVVGWKDRAYSLGIRGKIGKPDAVGDFMLGYSDLGYQNKFSGVYQSRPRKTGRIWVKMRYSLPPDTYSAIKQANREKFALAVASWNNLSFSEQVVWNKIKYPYHMSGYNRFISWYMKNN